jgi:hypothetical protein
MRVEKWCQVGWNVLVGSVVLLALGCGGEDAVAPTTGSLEVTTTTSGPDPDVDGYTISIDGGAEVALGADATLRRDDLGAGEHSVRLSGVAGNCTVEGPNPRTVTVTAGQPTSLTFVVSCTALPPTTGTLTITTLTTGSNLDPDGYTASVDGGGEQLIGINTTLSIPTLAPGTHSVALEGLAANCAVEGDNPQDVTIVAGATANAAFAVSCPTPMVRHWSVMQSGTMKNLLDISGSSATNVFAVGQNPSGLIESKILHYDGTAWSTQLTQPGLALNGVWTHSASDAFAVGRDLNDESDLGTILHYDGQRWTRMIPPAFDRPGTGLGVFPQAVWGSSATDVFVVGEWGSDDVPGGAEYVAHYDGVKWSLMGQGVVFGLIPHLKDVWGSSGSDVYTVGTWYESDSGSDVSTGGVIHHYDGRQWSTVLDERGLYPRAVWGTSAQDVYVTGTVLDAAGAFKPLLMHFDGLQWSRTSPTAHLGEIWGASPNNLFATGGTRILHFDGASWTQATTSSELLHAIWGSSATDVFAVGGHGIILHGTP